MIESRKIAFDRNVEILQTRIVYEIDELYLLDTAKVLYRKKVESLSKVLLSVSRKLKAGRVFDLNFCNFCSLLPCSLNCHNLL